MSEKPQNLLAQTHLSDRQLRSTLAEQTKAIRDRLRRLAKIQEMLVNSAVQPEGELVPVEKTLSRDDLTLITDPTRGL
jgi:two-component sensor histidine kinase